MKQLKEIKFCVDERVYLEKKRNKCCRCDNGAHPKDKLGQMFLNSTALFIMNHSFDNRNLKI